MISKSQVDFRDNLENVQLYESPLHISFENQNIYSPILQQKRVCSHSLFKSFIVILKSQVNFIYIFSNNNKMIVNMTKTISFHLFSSND